MPTPSVTSWFPLDNTDVPKQAFRTWGEQLEAEIAAAVADLAALGVDVDAAEAILATLGTAAFLDHGTGADNIVKLDATGKLPAVDGSALLNLPGGGGGGVNPSLVINGGFQLNQRLFAGGALSAGVFGFDRWKAATGGANLSLSGYVLTLTSGAIEQVIEPSIAGLASFAGQAVAISVEAPSANITVNWGDATGTINAGAGRQTLTLTSTTGGNTTLKLTAPGGGVTFGRVKLELGATATGWQARPPTIELFLSRRYFERQYYSDNKFISVVGARTGGAGAVCTGVFYYQEKRATPTITYSLDGNTATVNTWDLVGLSGEVFTITSLGVGISAADVTVTVSSPTSILAKECFTLRGFAGRTAYVDIDSEL